MHIKQPDLSDIQVSPKEKKFKGYFKIARHYGWALNQTFFNFNFDTVIIVEGKHNLCTFTCLFLNFILDYFHIHTNLSGDKIA